MNRSKSDRAGRIGAKNVVGPLSAARRPPDAFASPNRRPPLCRPPGSSLGGLKFSSFKPNVVENAKDDFAVRIRGGDLVGAGCALPLPSGW